MSQLKTTRASRREFLRQASALSIAGAAAPFAINLASIGAASAQVAGGYKALVCVFLYGANDGHNTVVPFDAANYAKYSVGRRASHGMRRRSWHRWRRPLRCREGCSFHCPPHLRR